MKIKKLLFLPILILFFSFTAFSQPDADSKHSFSYMKSSDTGIYGEGLLGYNRYAFSDGYADSLAPGAFGFSQRQWSNGVGNFVFGAIVGYQFSKFVSAEAGGFYTLKAKYSYVFSGFGSTKTTIKVQPWYVFLGGRLAVPVYHNFIAFTKLGAGYQKTRITDDPNAKGHQSKWGPMFGGGLAYYFPIGAYIDVQWLRFTGEIKNGTVDNTAPNFFLLGLGYKFAM